MAPTTAPLMQAGQLERAINRARWAGVVLAISLSTVQGYHIARPMPEADVLRWLAALDGLPESARRATTISAGVALAS